MNNLISVARALPAAAPRTTISVSPVILDVPGRPVPLELRITAPIDGDGLPIVLLSHGHGPSLYITSKDGYAPLVHFLAEQGFALIQPTHANSKVAGFATDAPGAPLFWRERRHDMVAILDRLDSIELLVPVIAGRLDHDRVAVVGHSLGGHTASLLLGARLSASKEPALGADLSDPRIKAGVLLAAPGRGADLGEPMRSRAPGLALDFAGMTTRTLVVYGDADVSPHLTTRGADWHADPFDSPGADGLLTLFGCKHGLGGIAGYDARETDDEDPDRLAVTQRMTAAYLRSAFDRADPSWSDACAALRERAPKLGRVDRK
ncbi:chlorophyllase [Sphingosinicella sp. BN140058]|uniref:alpha/beta hydrolase family protein n=1 Tax=Sphingosinicella sp. BN140058 TaxID=1892855 RepID=UPI0010114D3F|nr:chlorophyllase [Sphingosinicella sp. BN140058]QAY76420.1 chlorophyllase [Sphingosinicella sp. BN140058]